MSSLRRTYSLVFEFYRKARAMSCKGSLIELFKLHQSSSFPPPGSKGNQMQLLLHYRLLSILESLSKLLVPNRIQLRRS